MRGLKSWALLGTRPFASARILQPQFAPGERSQVLGSPGYTTACVGEDLAAAVAPGERSQVLGSPGYTTVCVGQDLAAAVCTR